jgi:hypothetical protein
MSAPGRPGFGISFGSGHGARSGFAAYSGRQQGPNSPLLLGSPYFYSDAFYAPATPEPSAPQVFVLQTAPVVETPKEPPRPEPLLIELQGDRYVRLGDANATAKERAAPADFAGSTRQLAKPNEAAMQPLPPAVLVYRDGHEEQVRDYTIADGILYARGDYWTDGYWNKKIRLAALNLPASMKASQKNGVKFTLPASPNEVITRP